MNGYWRRSGGRLNHWLAGEFTFFGKKYSTMYRRIKSKDSFEIEQNVAYLVGQTNLSDCPNLSISTNLSVTSR